MHEFKPKKPLKKGDAVYDRTPRHGNLQEIFIVDRVIGEDSVDKEPDPNYKDEKLLAAGYSRGDCIIRSKSGPPQRQPAFARLLEHAL